MFGTWKNNPISFSYLDPSIYEPNLVQNYITLDSINSQPLRFLRRIWVMPRRYPAEQRARATRLALDRLGEYPSAWAAAQALGPKLGVGAGTLRKWILQAQVDAGRRWGPSSEEFEEIRRLKAKVRELKEANEILKAASISSRITPR